MQMLIAVASRAGAVRLGVAQWAKKSIVALGLELGLVIAARINYAKHSPNIGTSDCYRKKTHRNTKMRCSRCDAVNRLFAHGQQ